MPVNKRILRGNLNKVRRKRLTVRKNFSVVEDSYNSIVKIKKIATAAVQMASLENRRLKLATLIIKDNKVIKANPDGTKETIAEIRSPVAGKYKVGTVLHAR